MNSWIKSIVIFTVFSSLVMFLLPDEKYRKYIRTGIGFVMVIIVINPILSIEDLNDYLSFDYFYEAAGSSLSENDTRYYKDLMENIIEEYIKENYNTASEADIEFDDSYIISKLEIVFDAGENKDIFGEDEFCAEMSELYGVSAENIFIDFK